MRSEISHPHVMIDLLHRQLKDIGKTTVKLLGLVEGITCHGFWLPNGKTQEICKRNENTSVGKKKERRELEGTLWSKSQTYLQDKQENICSNYTDYDYSSNV